MCQDNGYTFPRTEDYKRTKANIGSNKQTTHEIILKLAKSEILIKTVNGCRRE